MTRRPWLLPPLPYQPEERVLKFPLLADMVALLLFNCLTVQRAPNPNGEVQLGPVRIILARKIGVGRASLGEIFWVRLTSVKP